VICLFTQFSKFHEGHPHVTEAGHMAWYDANEVLNYARHIWGTPDTPAWRIPISVEIALCDAPVGQCAVVEAITTGIIHSHERIGGLYGPPRLSR
jgi:hypothetical protein